ncbi:Planctomycete cytochrome C [Crateriforma conspicua]|uniref:Planctomycete cytochrome C n=2 Tax=Crateriforma conspicua TaxID=2527996 RepID=A0A5C5Y3S1_9PLAN|nr:Planctomycete cytochrome C [Crateriforma conspicua]
MAKRLGFDLQLENPADFPLHPPWGETPTKIGRLGGWFGFDGLGRAQLESVRVTNCSFRPLLVIIRTWFMTILRITSQPGTRCILACLVVFCFAGDATAQSAPEGLATAKDQLAKAAVAYRNREYVAAGQALVTASSTLQATLAKTEPARREAVLEQESDLLSRMRNAHVMLQLEGVRVPPIRIDDGTAWWQEEPGVAPEVVMLPGAELDPDASLASSLPKKEMEAMATSGDVPAMASSTGDSATGDAEGESDTVSFVRDVAPVLIEHCGGCHVGGGQVRGGLNMNTFAGLMRGGDEGDTVIAGSGDESGLVLRMRGEGGDLMPPGGRPRVPEDAIQLISRWIDQGAKDDAIRPGQDLKTASMQAWASSATTDQRNERRRQHAQESIRMVAPDGVAMVESDYFLVIGPMTERRLREIGKLADGQMKVVRSVIPAVSGADKGEYFRGRATLFVFPRPYEYAEFSKMVEQRSIPAQWVSHFRSDAILAYASLVVTPDLDDEGLRSRLAGPLFSMAMATRAADVPEWLAGGVGESIANDRVRKLDRDSRSRLLAAQRDAAIAAKNAGDLLQQRLPAQQVDALSIAVAGAMMAPPRRRGFQTMIRQMNAGQPFESGFQGAYGVTVEAFVDAFLKWAKGPTPTPAPQR